MHFKTAHLKQDLKPLKPIELVRFHQHKMQAVKREIKQEAPSAPAPEIKRVKLEMAPGDQLDSKQREILNLCLTGRNIFLTGVGGAWSFCRAVHPTLIFISIPGTGKTYLLRKITEAMREKYGKNRVAVTALTGVAALQAEGQTLHSLTGAGVPSIVGDFEKCRKNRDAWRLLACLIIDEVSLIVPSYLDFLDSMIRDIRKSPSAAFGKIQLIFCGDLLQLGAICKGVSLISKCPFTSDFNPTNIPVMVDQFQAHVFQTICWRDAGFSIAELTKIYRQSDVVMIHALMKIRRGVVDDEVRSFVSSCVRELPRDGEIKPTILYSRNIDVDFLNQTNLNALPSKPEEFMARDAVYPDAGAPVWIREKLLRDQFFKNGQVPERVTLKVGAQVLLTKNLDKVLVNGSRGIVKHFMTKEKSIENLTDRISVCMDDALRAGLVSQLEAVKISPPSVSYPVVLFNNGEQMLCSQVEFKHRVWNAGECKRFQVPLKLAWSITVHRSQGSSLDRVQVDLGGCFAVGQAYVAISRARTISGLQIVGFTDSAVRANPLAVEFHNALSAGTLDEFLKTVPMWFAPLMQPGIDPNWLALFESSEVFRGWMV
jgi:ATP-dependent DNA helicase PIF1